MANHLQAKKRIRQTVKRYAQNASIRTNTRKSIKAVRMAIESGDTDKARDALGIAIKKLDKSVTKDVLNRKTASRTISRLTKAVNSLQTQ